MKILTPARHSARALVEYILAALEPLMAALYWPCLSAKAKRDDRRANEASGNSWYLDSALRAGTKASNHHA